MNAIELTTASKTWKKMGLMYENPPAIVCISAHWLTDDTRVTGQAHPRMIYDFLGFPPELYQVKYPAPGDVELATQIHHQIAKPPVILDATWGFDHGSWMVLSLMYPLATVPVIQLSINIEQPPRYHYELGKQLRFLREQGVLILASGNIVHNLSKLKDQDAQPYDWAEDFDRWIAERIGLKQYDAIVDEYQNVESVRLSVPTPDHFYPLLYILGAADSNDNLTLHHEGFQNGSISMRSFSLGSP